MENEHILAFRGDDLRRESQQRKGENREWGPASLAQSRALRTRGFCFC